MDTPLPAGLERLDPRAVAYLRTVRWIRVLIETAGFALLLALAFADGWLTPALRATAVVLAVAIVLLEVVFAIVWPPIAHRHVGYRVNAQGIEIHRGVWWRSVATVARSRIQHLDVTQGPVQRRFGLATLGVHTAGTHGATVPLGGLAVETARRLRDDLDAGARDEDGV